MTAASGGARRALAALLALVLAAGAAAPPAAADMVAAQASPAGTLVITKAGGPVTEGNAGDEFPITVELVNAQGLDLGSVTVSERGGAAPSAAGPAPSGSAAAGLAAPGAPAGAASGLASTKAPGTLRAQATTYTVTLNYNVNGGSIADSSGVYYSSGKDKYYKVVSGFMYVSDTKNGTYKKATGTVKSNETYHNLQDISTWGVSRPGYHISGTKAYNTKADGSGLDLSQQNTASDATNPATTKRINGGTQVTGDKTITIYMNWIANSYTVTYDANGGTGAPSATTHTYGQAKALAAGKPTRSHYTFAGWQVNGTGTVYAAGQSVSNLTTANNGTVTMKAKWTEDPKCTVTYDGNGGTPARSSDTVYAGEQVTLPGATRAGYAFKGWATSSSATSGATGKYTVSASGTLYAVWAAPTRRVITVKLSPGGSVTLSGVPEGTSYKVVDGEQPACWELVSASPQSGAIGRGESAEVVSESAYTAPPAELSFSVPTTIGFAARADGTLIGPSDGAVRIESSTDAAIAVTGVRAEAAAGYEIVADPDSPGQVAFSFAPEGGGRTFAADIAGDEMLDVRWPIAPNGSIGICGIEGRVAGLGDVGATARKVASVTWRVALDGG